MKDHPLYPLALWKTALEERHEKDPYVRELLDHLLAEGEVDREEFEAYLETYHNDLRNNCRKKAL